jgi:transcriptional regulator with XRE-family HTH domain
MSKLPEGDSEVKLRRDLGRRIVRARIARDLSQMDLAKLLGIDRSRLGKWERGHHAPLLKQLVALSQVLALSLDELIAGQAAAAEGEPRLGAATRETLHRAVEVLTQLLSPKPRPQKPD